MDRPHQMGGADSVVGDRGADRVYVYRLIHTHFAVNRNYLGGDFVVTKLRLLTNMKHAGRAIRCQEGFTLIEMLIVLFVIGALLLVILPNLTGTGEDAQAKACDANVKLIQTQSESYYLDNAHTYPSGVDVLVREGYLSNRPVCPADENATYSIQQTSGEVTCSHHD
jgi:competence protein ComGC